MQHDQVEDQVEDRMPQRRNGKAGSQEKPRGLWTGQELLSDFICDDRSKRQVPHPTSGRSPRSTWCLLTIRRVGPEGDLDLKLPVGIFDGGKWQEGVRCLGEVGYHSLCREKAIRETPVAELACAPH